MTKMIDFPHWVEGPTPCKMFTTSVVIPSDEYNRHVQHITNTAPVLFFAAHKAVNAKPDCIPF